MVQGQSDGSKEPLPSLFRKKRKEHDLTTFFATRAAMYTERTLPQSPAQWLSLMQHVRLPTRLLDWSDSALLGLYFALMPDEPLDAVVWLLNPIELNRLCGITNLPASHIDPVKESYQLAFAAAQPKNPPQYPIAVSPAQVHVRMAVQRDCFTIHDKDERSFVAQFEAHPLSNDGHLVKLCIPSIARKEIKRDLDLLGVKQATAVPKLGRLGKRVGGNFHLLIQTKEKACGKQCVPFG